MSERNRVKDDETNLLIGVHGTSPQLYWDWLHISPPIKRVENNTLNEPAWGNEVGQCLRLLQVDVVVV